MRLLASIRARASTALLISVIAAAFAPSHALSATVDVPFINPGGDPLRLSGGYDQFQGAFTVPPRWSSWDGTIRLQWRTSDAIIGDSGLRASVGGKVVGTVRVAPGRGSATFQLPETVVRQRNLTVPVTIETRLRTRDSPCPPPDSLDAFLEIEDGSKLSISGSWRARPTALRSLPAAMTTNVGRERTGVLIDFSEKPDDAALRAAGVAAGEIAAAAGRSAVIRVSLPGAERRALSTETIVKMEPSTGPASLRTSLGPDGQPAVVLAGNDLVRAAVALNPKIARTLSGTVSSELPPVKVTRSDLPRRIPLPSGDFRGIGTGTVSSSFDLPVWREALRGSRLRIAYTANAPAGGRATVGINSRSLETTDLRAEGETRYSNEIELAPRGPALYQADLLPGRNEVKIDAELNRPRNLCKSDAELGTVRMTDFASVTVLTRARPVLSTLTTWPFPLNRQPAWRGATVQLPEAPTVAELEGIIGVLSEGLRVTGEPSLPAVQFGGAVPKGPSMTLARPGQVPASLGKKLTGPAVDGVLAASKDSGGVHVLAVGPRALGPLSVNYSIGKVQGREVQALLPSQVAIRVNDVQRVTGIERGATSWRWPIIIIVVAGVGLVLLGIRGAARRVRRGGE